MEYVFSLPKFDGPLDLLLHLIKQAEIDIFEIKISDITDQYMNYLKSMEELNLNVDSEYLVLASDLMVMKARELLPQEILEEDEEDPRESLINRLLEYQKYKEVSQDFKLLENDRKKMFSKLPSLMDDFHDDKIKIDEGLTLDDLVKALMQFQERKEFDKPLNTVVTHKEYSVYKRGIEIKRVLSLSKEVRFEDLFEIKNRSMVVVTFLAILDLVKKGEVLVSQKYNLDVITLKLKGENL